LAEFDKQVVSEVALESALGTAFSLMEAFFGGLVP
tara:strand:+ start:1860 stop:1964 length:105 start_codon:yes stop_codon:yes gene_type:complete